MKIIAHFFWRSVLVLFAALWLSACGGGGGGSGEGNKAPPTVLQPIESKAISLQFDAPARINSDGRLTIALNAFSQEQGDLQIDWTLPAGFSKESDSEGKISIKAPKVTQDTNYQIAVEIKDSKNNLARHVHDIRVLRRVSTVTITGMVTDTVIANAKVSAWLGNDKLGESDADENGIYALSLTLPDNTLVALPVELRASGDESRGQGFVEFRSLIPSLTSLIADSGQTNSDKVTIDTSVNFGVNITNVTSAVSSLLPQTSLESDQALNQALLSINTAEVLRRATLIKLLVDKPTEYSLPDGVNNTLVFLQDSDAKQQIEDQARQTDDFQQVQQAILNDNTLVSDNAKLAAAEYIVQLDPDAFALHLNADGTGQIHAYTSSDITWSYANRIHTITVANPVETYRDEDGWRKRLKKMELQVINQSNGRAMANITRVFDRLHNASIEDELTLVDDAILINKQNTLLIPYQTLLGDWQVSESIYQGETFNVRLDEHGSSYDYAENSYGSWQLANNRLLMPYQEQGKPATTEIWFTTLLGEVGEQNSESFPTYRFFAIDRFDDGSNFKVIHGTFAKLMEPPYQPDTRPLSQQADIQDPALAQCIDDSGYSHLSSIRYLSCADSSQQAISSLQGLSNITGLETLRLGYLQPTSLVSSDFPSSLQELTIHNSELFSLDLDGLDQLRVLDIWNTVIDSIDFTSLTQLTELYLPNNPHLLSQSALSALTKLKRLDLSGNQLTEIDLKGLNQLTHLLVGNNQLTALDLSDNPNLQELQAWDNKLSELDVGHLLQLEYLILGGNQLNQLDVSNNIALKSLNIANNDFNHVEVGQLEQLTYLNVGGNHLNSLDVSSNFMLSQLWAFDNQLTSLDLSHNPELLILYLYNNQLSSLDIHHLLALEELGVSSNNIDYIDVSQNTKLYWLNVSYNNLAILDVTSLPHLTSLQVSGTQLTNLDVSQNTKLNWLNVSNNQLSELNIDHLSELEFLDIASNKLIEVDVSQNTKLQWLYVSYNQLTSLDVSQNTKLQWLGVSYNQLTSLDVSQNTKLNWLNVDNNQLSELNIDHLSELEFLDMANNKMIEIDVSQNTKLQRLDVSDNKLTELDVTSLPELETLYASNNQLTKLDITNLSELKDLTIRNNQLSNLDISTNVNLYYLSVRDNQLTSLDISNNPILDYLEAGNNKLKTFDTGSLSYAELPDNQLTILNINGNSQLEWLYASNNQLTTISGIEELNVNAFIDLTDNPFELEFEAYLRDLQNQGYSNLYF